MVRTLIKGLLVLLVIAGVAPFILPMQEGRPLLSIEDVKAPSMPKLPPLPELPEVTIGASTGTEATQVTFYRWQDEEGSWRFSDEPPAAGVPFETVTADISPTGMEPPRPLEPNGRGNEHPAPVLMLRAPDAAAAETAMPYDPETIGKMFEQSREVQTLLNERTKRLDEQL